MRLTAAFSPACFEAAQPLSLDLAVTADEPLAPGARIEVQFPNSWTVVSGPSHTRDLQTTEPAAPHHLSVAAPGRDAAFTLAIAKRHLTFPESTSIRHGRLLTATLQKGSVPAGSPVVVRYANTFAPYLAGRQEAWVRVNGQAPDPAPALEVRGGPHARFRLLIPSGAEPGREFEALLVSLDRFENASSTPFPAEPLRLADGAVLGDLPAFTGSVRAPVRLPAAGVYRVQFRDTLSNAVVVKPGRRGPFWGDIHIHSELSMDGQGNDPFGYARNVSGLDFAGVADHWQSLGPPGYETLERWTEAADEPGRFATIPGDERNPAPLGAGHYNLYFRSLADFRAHRALAGQGDKASPEHELAALKALDPAGAMLIPHHTGITFSHWRAGESGAAIAWTDWETRGLRPVLEIYSHHGQSERYDPHHILAYEFNRMRNPERRTNTSVPGPYYAQDYWAQGRRIGVMSSSDDHAAQGGRRHGGVTAAWSDALTREAVFDAIRQRRCYATTGERILLDFAVAGLSMGQSGARRGGDKLPIRLGVWGTDKLVRVDILRHRFGVDTAFTPLISAGPRPESSDAMIEIEDDLQGPCVYYARVLQEPLDWPGMAWTSPIWVDVADA